MGMSQEGINRKGESEEGGSKKQLRVVLKSRTQRAAISSYTALWLEKDKASHCVKPWPPGGWIGPRSGFPSLVGGPPFQNHHLGSWDSSDLLSQSVGGLGLRS